DKERTPLRLRWRRAAAAKAGYLEGCLADLAGGRPPATELLNESSDARVPRRPQL
ncbi:MAG: hypothetical protein AVDCRST_MAG77-1730, partial [uncultured Chloroflexi bacterium]